MPIYPQSGKADVSTWEVQPVVALALDWVGELAETLPEDVLGELKLVDRTERVPQRPPARVDRRRPQGAAAAALRRVPPHAGGPRRPQARDRGRGVGDRAHRRRRAARPVPRRAAVRAHRRPAHARSTRSPPTWPEPVPMHRLAAGRGRLGQDARRDHRAADGGAGRLPGRADGADRGARRAAVLGGVVDALGARGAERGDAARRAAGDGGAAHQPRRRGRPPARSRPGSPPATSTSSSAPTRCSTATRRSRSSASRSSTSSTASASSSARCCATSAPRPTCS